MKVGFSCGSNPVIATRFHNQHITDVYLVDRNRLKSRIVSNENINNSNVTNWISAHIFHAKTKRQERAFRRIFVRFNE